MTIRNDDYKRIISDTLSYIKKRKIDNPYYYLSMIWVYFNYPFNYKNYPIVKKVVKRQATVDDFFSTEEENKRVLESREKIENILRSLIPDIHKNSSFEILSVPRFNSSEFITFPISIRERKVENNRQYIVEGNPYNSEYIQMIHISKSSAILVINQVIKDIENKLNHCLICGKQNVRFKSIRRNSIVYFCCIKCFESWNIN